MDEDTFFAIYVIVFLCIIFTLPCSITACIAASRTRAWTKDKRRQHERRYGPLPQKETTDPEAALDESEDSESEHDSDYLDSEDERYATTKREQKRKAREEKDADMALSTTAKFCKEWKRAWSGSGGLDKIKQEAEAKAEEERRKIAREAVREYLRMERKKARKARKVAEEGVELPSYGRAVEGEKA